LLRRAGDPWAELFGPPPSEPPDDLAAAVIGTFAAEIALNCRPRLRRCFRRTGCGGGRGLDQAESLGRSHRPAQRDLARIAAETLAGGGVAAVEAGPGTGKSLGYLVPAALAARRGGPPVVVSTFTRVLQNQLVAQELPFVQQLVPELTFAQLQGRANYLSLSRLAEEVEDALAEERLPPSRAWLLAALVRFAECSAHGNLEELGYIPLSLDEYLGADGAVMQMLAALRSSPDDPLTGLTDFYRRARENAERADLLVVNHALLLKRFLDEPADAEEGIPFARHVVVTRRYARRGGNPCARARSRSGHCVGNCEPCTPGRSRWADGRLSPGFRVGRRSCSATALAAAVDAAQAGLDGLVDRLRRYVHGQTVVSDEDLRRYGVRVRFDAGALAAAGGPALRTAADTFRDRLHSLVEALARLANEARDALPDDVTPDRRPRRAFRLARSLLRDLRRAEEDLRWFWSFADAGRTVRIIELGRTVTDPGDCHRTAGCEHDRVPVSVGRCCGGRCGRGLTRGVYLGDADGLRRGFDFFLGGWAWAHRLASAERHERWSRQPCTPSTTNQRFSDAGRPAGPARSDLRGTSGRRRRPAAPVHPLLRRQDVGPVHRQLARDRIDRVVEPLAEQGLDVLCRGSGSLPQLLDQFRREVSVSRPRSLWEAWTSRRSRILRLSGEVAVCEHRRSVEAARMGAVEAAGATRSATTCCRRWSSCSSRVR
jgi:hypothetical protein